MDYKQKIKFFEDKYQKLMFDFYEGATIINKLIYNQKLLDRYYVILDEFKNLKSNIYTNKHIEKLMNEKQDNTILVINIYRSRALGLLSIADAIWRLSTSSSQIGNHQNTCLKLKELHDEMEACANNNLRFANMLARDVGYEEYYNSIKK